MVPAPWTKTAPSSGREEWIAKRSTEFWARGGAEIYIRIPHPDYVEWIWDHAAGYVVITEAGGEMTDIDGNPMDFSVGAKLRKEVRGIAMTNGGKFHQALLQAFREQEAARLEAAGKS